MATAPLENSKWRDAYNARVAQDADALSHRLHKEYNLGRWKPHGDHGTKRDRQRSPIDPERHSHRSAGAADQRSRIEAELAEADAWWAARRAAFRSWAEARAEDERVLCDECRSPRLHELMRLLLRARA